MNPMFRAGLLGVCLWGATPALVAQESVQVATAPDGVVIRALDMLTGKLEDLEVAPGQMVKFERLEITLTECRYPVDNPLSDAFAYLRIRDIRDSEDRFDGWMTAASPALSAMDHPRYDVWVLRCKISAAETTDEG